MAAPKILVTLDRRRAIAWSNRARYRLGTIKPVPSLEDLNDVRTSYSALVGFLWAMLADRPEEFATPEALAEHVAPERLAEYVEALANAINAAGDSPKNANGSTQSPSPASSSS